MTVLKEAKDKIVNGAIQFFNQFKTFFWGLGFFGWQIAFVYALYISFRENIIYGFLFFIFFTLSGFINEKVLKELIYDLRPANSTPFLTSEVFKKRANGMPSGHAQQTAFALTYTYLFTRKYFLLSLTLFIITVLQRYIFHNHTAPQLIVGGIFGVILGILSYIVMQKLKPKLQKYEFTYNPVTWLEKKMT